MQVSSEWKSRAVKGKIKKRVTRINHLNSDFLYYFLLYTIFLLKILKQFANTHLSKAIVHSKNGQRNGGKENRKLGPQKNNLKINKQLPEMSILNTVWQCRIRLLAQCRSRQLSTGPAMVHFILTACAIFQEAFLVGSHSRYHSKTDSFLFSYFCSQKQLWPLALTCHWL